MHEILWRRKGKSVCNIKKRERGLHEHYDWGGVYYQPLLFHKYQVSGRLLSLFQRTIVCRSVAVTTDLGPFSTPVVPGTPIVRSRWPDNPPISLCSPRKDTYINRFGPSSRRGTTCRSVLPWSRNAALTRRTCPPRSGQS